MEEKVKFDRVEPGPVSLPWFIGAVVLVIAMFGLNFPNLAGQSVTVDEYAHLPAGYSYLIKGNFRIYPKNPPLIKMIEALPLLALRPKFPLKKFYDVKGGWAPWEFADAFVNENRKEAVEIYVGGRFMSIWLGVALALVVYFWATRLYGPRSGLLAMFLTAASPNILAHSGLATVDVGFALFFVLTWYLLWMFFDRHQTVTLILAAVSFGVAQISKFSGLIMVPTLAIIFIALLIRNGLKGESRQRIDYRDFILQLLIIAAVVGGMTIAVINTGYFGKKMFSPLAGGKYLSKTMTWLSNGPEAKLPLPLPGEYVTGLDAQLADAERGEFPSYINGEWRRKGVWYYFLESLALKVPVPALALIIMGLIYGAWRAGMSGVEIRPPRLMIGRGHPAWPFVHLPAFIFLAVSSLFGNLQLGIRYVLPVLPLLFIAASRVVGGHRTDVKTTDRAEKVVRKSLGAVAIVLCLWQAVDLGMTVPHYLSYFNGIAGCSEGGHRYLIDSNIDWGQDLPGLKREMDKLGIKEIGLLYFGHIDPEIYGIRYHLARPGDQFAAISVNFLHGYPYSLSYLREWSGAPPMIMEPQYRDSARFAVSLLDKQPAERIGGSIYLYDLRDGR